MLQRKIPSDPILGSPAEPQLSYSLYELSVCAPLLIDGWNALDLQLGTGHFPTLRTKLTTAGQSVAEGRLNPPILPFGTVWVPRQPWSGGEMQARI